MMLVGDLGIIVLAVAILPLLGVGGAQLFKAESAAPLKDQKLTPRMAETARGLWSVYFVMSLACFGAYRWAGMGLADAFMHMCTTMGLGGFSSHDLSFGYWNSPRIEAVAVVFMMLAGINFALYFVVWRQRSLRVLWQDPEVRTFYGGGAGYGGADHGLSDAARLLLLLEQARRELVRIVHPNAVNPVIFAGNAVSPRVMQSVIAYKMIYGASMIGLTMLLLFSGLEVVTTFTAVVACLSNIGSGLGEVGPSVNFGGLTVFQTWVFVFGMLLGRLELLSLVVLFTPQFWR